MGADTESKHLGVAAAHFSEVRPHSGRHAARAMHLERSIIIISPSLSGALLTVISRPSYVTSAPTSKEEPCTSLVLM